LIDVRPGRSINPGRNDEATPTIGGICAGKHGVAPPVKYFHLKILHSYEYTYPLKTVVYIVIIGAKRIGYRIQHDGFDVNRLCQGIHTSVFVDSDQRYPIDTGVGKIDDQILARKLTDALHLPRVRYRCLGLVVEGHHFIEISGTRGVVIEVRYR